MNTSLQMDNAQLERRQRQLGLRIFHLRKSRGWSQDTFAHLVGLGRSYPYMIETGQVDLRFSTLLRIAHVFDLSVVDLLAQDEDRA